MIKPVEFVCTGCGRGWVEGSGGGAIVLVSNVRHFDQTISTSVINMETEK